MSELETNNDSNVSNILSEIEENDNLSLLVRDKYIRLKRILERNCKDLTREEALQFPSFFARLVFIAQKYTIPKSLEWQLQNIRVKASFLLKSEQNIVTQSQYEKAKKTIVSFFSFIYDKDESNEITVAENPETLSSISLDRMRVQVLDIDRDNEVLVCQADADILCEALNVRYSMPTNDAFNQTIDKLWIGVQLNLIDVKIDTDGCYIPRVIVLEPDYLIDTSALAECFQNYGRSHLHYFRKKFEQTPNSHYILMGNLANFFLDELIYAQDAATVDFNTTFLKAFKQTPFEFTSCEDIRQESDFRSFMSRARTQFDNIKRVVLNDFPKNNIDIQRCTLEPSFFCEKFGFQGRLDLLQLADNNTDLDKIIELKSGGLPYPKEDPAKIAINHETQTAIYRLIIETVFNRDSRKIHASILYSASENVGENIRLSAPYQKLEKEIINVRNLIVATEHDLYIGDSDNVERSFAQTFNLDSYGKVPQFFTDRLGELELVLNNCSPLERAYFFRYVSFISRELYLQKVGDDNYESNRSVAALWNTEFQERLESFDLIADLVITRLDDSGDDLKITFERKSDSNFVNFREGEICILYPRGKDGDSVLSNQILKGVIAEISNEHVLVRFRYKQRNLNFFHKHDVWAIEHDILDHAYNGMFRGMFSFLSAPVEKKNLILGLSPSQSPYIDKNIGESLSAEEKQNKVIEKAISAQDYFLIVGPPGTGKTSIFARRLIELFYADETKNILVMAYTNRAVDELCEAVNMAFGCVDGGCDSYIRIGTELSCREPYRHRLLQTISKQAKSREELRNVLLKTRIYIGTLASITGKQEIFKLKKFDIAIIDEASQILEPQVVGLLPYFDKFIMIGDHKQLSTITLQDELKSKVDDENLNKIGLLNCRESLFERLFRICQENNWSSSFDILTYQGRMHKELASFPNKYFYDGLLLEANEWQDESLNLILADSSDKYQQLVANNRIAFISSREVNNSLSDKLNEGEADEVVYLTKAILAVYKASNISFESKTIGIITPYRNQIALIRHKLEATGISEFKDIMIDTVERYQGSQRDIIILSFCINKPYQLDLFCNLNHDGTVDRKLNVALTRARKQLFLVGNDYILRQNSIYKSLIDSI